MHPVASAYYVRTAMPLVMYPTVVHGTSAPRGWFAALGAARTADRLRISDFGYPLVVCGVIWIVYGLAL